MTNQDLTAATERVRAFVAAVRRDPTAASMRLPSGYGYVTDDGGDAALMLASAVGADGLVAPLMYNDLATIADADDDDVSGHYCHVLNGVDRRQTRCDDCGARWMRLADIPASDDDAAFNEQNGLNDND